MGEKPLTFYKVTNKNYFHKLCESPKATMYLCQLEPRLDRGDGVGGTGDSGSNSGNVIMWISFSRRLWRRTRS
ncbi:hypothetical protein IGI04_026778 [Brassica rapa subsp. trilocularis]|uniref:Uncharacterized protein n=1 Tax=Brassica rapa subsp. trilocularis TaxID=1813537 RepID=A0ABQ7L0X9_BRACM|nr:hypothetical protein IGI04_026778 [Brassica rapa subsp. trilocularis]